MSDPKHDVFLSFRGEDTRDNFTSHLYAELCRQNIETFIDNKLNRGEEISPALYRAIEGSNIYVIILSEHYASSTWCLDELTEILKCKERYGREVIPVFYKVDPSNVRNQRHSYADDLVKHHLRFGAKVDAWKAALTQVAGLSGWDSQVTRPESTLVTEIVKDILKKLMPCCSSSNYEGMAGIDMHVQQIQSLLLLDSPTVRTIGIWGMGGIGKTTIAGAFFEKLSTQFSFTSIVLNVQQEIEKAGLDHVKSKFSFGPRLKQTKVLLVFDDLKDSDQLTDLIGTQTHSNFGLGSRIIVTSRDKQVLENSNADDIYLVREMNYQDSLQLFCSFAFKQNHPKETFVSLANKVLEHAQGLPLALKVLGSLLYGKTEKAWESELQKLEKLPDLTIFRLLKLSYDGLDEDQKDIFLDIACFYRGEFGKVVEHSLDCCGFSARIGMDVLEDKCLISISKGRVLMHDLIKEMGHEIVRLECVGDPGKRSRLWKSNEIYDVFKRDKGKGTDAVQCIFLNMDEIKKVQLHAKTFKKMRNLRIITFFVHREYVDDIQMCDYSNVSFDACLESLPNALKILHWEGFPQRSLPQDFCPDNLVTLVMRDSHLEQLWKRDQVFPKLKRLNLRNSKELIRVPDLSLSPNIEEVILSNCVSLIQVYSSSFLNKLNWLCLDGCIKLERLDIRSNILSRSSGLVALHGCYNFETLLISNTTDVIQLDNSPPFTLYYVDSSVRVLDYQTEIHYLSGDYNHYILYDHVSQSSTRINELCWLDVSDCMSLTCLPAELLKLKFLRRLSLNGCSKLEELPEIEETVENLKVLMLDRTSIKELPSSIHRLVGLEELSLKSCTKLKTIPSSIGNLSKLLKLDLSCCKSLETFPSSIFKLNLRELNFEGCSMLRIFPEILEPAESFVRINLRATAIKELPSSLHHLVGLEELSLQSCRKLKTIPSSIGNLSKLLELDLSYCESLETFPSSIFKLKLTELNFKGCSMLRIFPEILEPAESFVRINLRATAIKELPSSLHHLVGLEELSLQSCRKLKTIPSSIGNLSKLLKLDLSYCQSLETFPSSIFKLKLTRLDFEGCSMLRTFPEIPNDIGRLSSLTELSLQRSSIVNLPESMTHLLSLKSLDLSYCKLLECVPNLPANLNQVFAFDCPYIKRVVVDSRLKLLSDSKDAIPEFQLTSSQELNASFWSNFVGEVFIMISGREIPWWFHYSCQGHSVTMENDSLNLFGKNRLIGLALCVVLACEDIEDDTSVHSLEYDTSVHSLEDDSSVHSLEDDTSLTYKLGFEYEDEDYGRIPFSYGHLPMHQLNSDRHDRFIIQDHTIIWKHQFDLASIGNKLINAHNFTLEILDNKLRRLSYKSTFKVKECGLCPLYSMENDDNGIEEPSRGRAAQ